MSSQPLAQPLQRPVARVVSLDWPVADDYLLANERNRDTNHAAVRRFQIMLRKQQWVLTNDAVVIDRDGFVRNGQHRLSAISLERATGVPVMLLEGVDPDDRFSYDQGRRRTAKDIFAMKGKPGDDAHAAIARLMVVGERTFTSLLDAVNFAIAHERSITFALHETKRYANDPNMRGLARTGFNAALARAHASRVSPSRLVEFAYAMLRSDYERLDPPLDQKYLRRFRHKVITDWNHPGARPNQKLIFWQTQSVLHAWLHQNYEWPFVERAIHLFQLSKEHK